MGVPGVAQEGSRVVSQGALVPFSGLRVTTIASMRSTIESAVARIVVKRNTFERILFSRGRHIVLTNKKEKLVIVDVRNEFEHQANSIQGAILIPLQSIENGQDINQLKLIKYNCDH